MDRSNVFDNYEKVKTVGQGAFGTATLYRRKQDGQHVVMKEIYLLNMDISEKKSALNEVEILSTLSHPNIIRYLGSFQVEGTLMIIMEYADGGNLAQLINTKKNRSENFTEKGILNIVSQISAALAYMHLNKILHRDLKTANIFLNLKGAIKIGDFGISKMLNTRSQAQTVVGTPYYLSPEMCEGSDYNEKSDVWALGCILYELACLRKPFEAPTLPVLVQKITTCEYEDIPSIYSEDLSQLVKSILRKDFNNRPTAELIRNNIIPNILKQNQLITSHSNFSFSNFFNRSKPMERSILYEIYDFGVHQKVIPIDLPHKKILDFSVSYTHQIVVTSDNVYTWGENNYGQLAIGNMCAFKKYPTCVHNLTDKNIVKCAAGKSFSLFLNASGVLYSCGNGSSGCLGHGDWKMVVTPSAISFLSTTKISQVVCGDDHVVALSLDGKIFTWGSSKSGQLGQGHSQERCKPLEISIPEGPKIKSIFVGKDCTFLITFKGEVFVCGNNNCNKLGFYGQEKITLFSKLKLKHKIVSVAVGDEHTILLTDVGRIIGMGSNFEGQLGRDSKNNFSPQIIDLGLFITMVTSGPKFSAVADRQNVIWFWGTFPKCDEPFPQESTHNSNKSLCNTQREEIRDPQSILALFASKENIKKGLVIHLGQISTKGNSIYISVHTTAPPPLKQFSATDLQTSNFTSTDDPSIYLPSNYATTSNVANSPKIV